MPEYKIRRLTPDQIEAIKVCTEFEPDSITLTKTTATFQMKEPREWLARTRLRIAERDGKAGGHYKALHAVKRKLDAAIADHQRTEQPAPSTQGPKALRDLLRLD